MAGLRLRKLNLDHQQTETKKNHDHPDAHPPYRDAVCFGFSLSLDELVEPLAGRQVIRRRVQYISGGISHLATPSGGSPLAKNRSQFNKFEPSGEIGKVP